MKFLLYDRWLNMIGEIPMLSANHHVVFGGEDTLEFETQTVLADGDRILWDDDGLWREHVVNGIEQEHSSGQSFAYACESSLIWDLGHRQIRYAQWNNITAQAALTYIFELAPLWVPGEIEDMGRASFEFQKCSAYDAFVEIMEAFNCEWQIKLEVDKHGVTKRSVNVAKEITRDSGVRFDYKHGLEGVQKEILEDYCFTACYGYGKTSGTGPDGQLWCYVVNDEAAKLWGLPDGQGGYVHSEGQYENYDCEDIDQLTQETINYLNNHSAPPVNYKVDIPAAFLYGVREGETLTVVDKEFIPELRLKTRMAAMDRDLITKITTNAEFGTVVSLVPEVLSRANSSLAQISAFTSAVDSVSKQVGDMSQSITTGSVTLKSGTTTGTLTVKSDGLYFNDRRIGG